MITKAQLQASFKTPIDADLWLEPINAAMEAAQINTDFRRASFLAQCGHESNDLTALEESLNYSPRGLMLTFRRYFTEAEAGQFGRVGNKPADQEGIAMRVYGGRMGNRAAPYLDGYRYRGRGIIQLTGADNYQAYGKWAGIDALKNPGLLALPKDAAMSAAWYWKMNNLNRYADSKQFDKISKAINLGNADSSATANGNDDRIARFQVLRKVWKL